MKNLLHHGAVKGALRGRHLASVNFLDPQDLAGRRVLDIGCGFGWFEQSVLQSGFARMVGLEISLGDLQTARTSIRHEAVHFGVGQGIALPFQDDSFDTVVCWEVIEHVPKGTDSLLFREIRRVLRPGGKAYLSTPHQSWWSNALDPAWWLIGHRHYSRARLEALATEEGLVMDTVEVKGAGWTTWSWLNMYVAKWIFRREPFFHEWFLAQEDREYARTDGYANIFVKWRNP